jgi:multidrug efflux pump subunit AcrA (membrane-fusion protein)
MTGNYFKYLYLLLLLILCACGDAPEKKFALVPINVHAGKVVRRDIKEYITFNGVLQYQKKENIRSGVTGYIEALPFEIGSHIRAGQTFATVRTKEQEALQEVAKIDSSLARFSKPIRILSNASGVLTQLNVVVNDYIVEGEILATIAQPQSLVVSVNVPYEYRNTVKPGTGCEIILQDNTILQARLTGVLPVIDPLVQSQNFLIALPGHEELPENLNVQVRTILSASREALCIPKKALQSNELLTDFWVMKVLGDTLALKTPVHPLIQSDSLVEVSSEYLSTDDVVVTEGGYQMHDSTVVSIRP